MAKQLNVALNFTANTSQAKAEINNLQNSMANLSKFLAAPEFKMTKDIQEASIEAAKLQTALSKAVNTDTGQFDLSKFNKTLKQAGTSLNDVYKKFEAIGPEGRRTFLTLANSIASAEIPAKRFSNTLNSMWNTMKNTARWQISSSALHSLQGAVQSAFNYAEKLNKSLNNIRIVSGQSTEQMAEFAKEANKAAKSLSTTTTRYTDAALIYYQQGLNDEEVAKRTETTIKMANVTGDATQEVSSYMTAIWNNFAKGSTNLEHFGDVITALGAATASSSAEIAAGLEKFAAIGDTIGLSYEYATSSLATIVATTRQSEDVVGTALKTIFARIQGLKLGETLEDGTELNKYSQALASVGISIFEANGQMKNMDNILDEMGAKWKTLDKAQQTALAQTVAGVRQYTQLVALMDNWDFMEENLNTAYNSEGALKEQAKIYEESWQAASDRVRTAMETIFSDLVDDEFFIDLLNGVEDFLTFIHELIDSMGGLKGLLAGVSALIFKAFSPQIAASVENMAYNIKSLTGINKKEHVATQQQALDLASQIPTNDIQLNSELAEIDTLQQKTALQRERATYEKEFSNVQKEVLRNLDSQLDLAAKHRIQAEKNYEIASQELAIEEQKVKLQINPQALAAAEKKSRKTDGSLNLKALHDELRTKGLTEKATLSYINAIEKETQAKKANTQQTKVYEKTLENVQREQQNLLNFNVPDYGKAFTSAVSAVGSFTMAITSLNAAVDQIKDPDATGWQKFTGVTMSLTMGISMLIPAINAYKSAIAAANLGTLKETIALLTNSRAQYQNAADRRTGTAVAAKKAIVDKLVSKGISEETAKQFALNFVKTQGVKANLKLIASNKALLLSMMPLQVQLLAIVAAVAAVVAIVDLFTVSNKELNKSLDSYNEATEKASQLEQELKGINSQIDELLKKGLSQLTEEEEKQLEALRAQKVELENQLRIAERLAEVEEKKYAKDFQKRAKQYDFSGVGNNYSTNGAVTQTLQNIEYRAGISSHIGDIKTYDTQAIQDYKQQVEEAFNAQKMSEADYNTLSNRISDLENKNLDIGEDIEEDYNQAKAYLKTEGAKNDEVAYKAAQDAVERFYAYLGEAVDLKSNAVDIYGIIEKDIQDNQEKIEKGLSENEWADIIGQDFYDKLSKMSEETGLSLEFLADKLGLLKGSANALTQENVFDNLNELLKYKKDSDNQDLANLLDQKGEIEDNKGNSIDLGEENLKTIMKQSGLDYQQQQDILLNIDWENQSKAESIKQVLDQIQEAQDSEGLAFEKQAEALGYSKEQFEAVTAAMIRNNKELKGNEEGAKRAVIAQLRIQKALDNCSETWEEYGEALKEADKSNADYYEGLGKLADNLTDALGFEVGWEDVEKHLDLVKKALEGNADAAAQLTKNLAFDSLSKKIEDIDFSDLQNKLSKLGDDFAKFNSFDEFKSKWDDTQAYLLNNDLKVGEVVSDDYTKSLNSMIAAAGLTKDEANDYLGQIGYSGKLKTKKQTIKGSETKYEAKIGPLTFDGYFKTQDQTVEIPYIEDDTLTKTNPSTTLSNIGSGAGNSNKSKSGSGSSSKVSSEDKEKISDHTKRYKRVTDELEDQDRIVSRLESDLDKLYGKKRLEQIDKINKALKKKNDLLKEELNIAENYKRKDKNSLQEDLKKAQKKLGLKQSGFKFDKDGDIINYNTQIKALIKAYNDDIEEYNKKYADKSETDASKAAKEKLDAKKEYIEAVKKSADQYEETKGKVDELKEEIQDNYDTMLSNNFEKLSYEIELKITINENDKRELDYYFDKLNDDGIYKSAEALAYLYAGDGQKSLMQTARQQFLDTDAAISNLEAQRQLAIKNPNSGKGISQADYVEGLQEQLDLIYDNIEALRDYDDQMMNYYGETLEKASEELSKFTDKLEHQSEILEHYKKVLELTGKGKDYQMIGKVLSGQQSVLKNQLDVSKKYYDTLEAERVQAETYLKTLKEGTAAYELQEKKIEDIEIATREAYNQMTADAEAYLSNAIEIWENSLNKIKDSTENILTNNIGFDILLNSLSNLKTYQEEYLTDTNKLFETNKMLSQIQSDIDKTTNRAAKERLSAFTVEIESLQKKNKLSNLELEIAQAKYKQLQAQIALEEAQNAKSVVRLSRDNEGNYGYVYTADQQAINESENALREAENELYNIRLNATNNYGEKLIQAQKEYLDKVIEINENYKDDEIKRQEALSRAQEEYYNIVDAYSDLYALAQKEDARVVKEAWINQCSENIKSSSDWKAAMETCTKDIATAYQTMQSTTSEALKSLGLEHKNLEANINAVKSASSALAENITSKVIPAMSKEIDTVDELTRKYGEARQSYLDLIAAQEKKALGLAQTIKEESGVRTETDKDYEYWNKLISDAAAKKGGTTVAASNGTLHYTSTGDINAIVKRSEELTKSQLITNNERAKIILDRKEADEKVYWKVDKYGELHYAKTKEKLEEIIEEANKATKRPAQFASGGYTGDWGEGGKLALLHEKELVLNENDTSNLLKVVEVVRKFIDNNVLSAGISNIRSATIGTSNSVLEQVVSITAEFPNATDHNEIELAFDNLINRASQYANRK